MNVANVMNEPASFFFFSTKPRMVPIAQRMIRKYAFGLSEHRTWMRLNNQSAIDKYLYIEYIETPPFAKRSHK